MAIISRNDKSSMYLSSGLIFSSLMSYTSIVYSWSSCSNFDLYVKRAYVRDQDRRRKISRRYDLMCSPGNRWNSNHVIYSLSKDEILEDKVGSICQFHFDGFGYRFVRVRKDKRDPDSKFNCNEVMYNVVEPLTYHILITHCLPFSRNNVDSFNS